MSDLFWKLAINRIEKRVIKARHNQFTQVRIAAIVFTTEDSHGFIEFKANKYQNVVPLSAMMEVLYTRIRSEL